MTTPEPIYRVDEEYRRRVAHIVLTQRKAQGLKQYELADLASVSPAYLSRVERGDPHYTYHDDMFLRIAEALGLNAALVRPTVVPPAKATTAPVPLWTSGPEQDVIPERMPIMHLPAQEITLAGGTRIILTIEVVPAEKETA